ncbi:MAG: 4Fe-4S dicluster domain-containing protein [Armatimonadia bacterium]|nr:4Fe-4S dicluster domain-containing protein [Armatimonadia bacterium]
MAEARVVFHYPRTLIDVPIISQVAREFDLDFNILRANITPDSEGLLVLELAGDAGEISRALDWAREQGVTTQELEKDVVRDDEVCTQCGACVTICPTDALRADPETHEVLFDADECVACELCVPACPPRAMTVAF